MRAHAISLGLLIAIGSAVAVPLASGSVAGHVTKDVTSRGQSLGRAALSYPCCPRGEANAPCKTIVETTSNGTPSAELRSILAPLRRPTTPSDALPPDAPSIDAEGVYVRFIRRARVIDGSTFYLVPAAHACEKGFLAHETLFLLTVGGPFGSGVWPPVAAWFIKHQGYSGGFGWDAGTETVSGLVPDGVAKVTLRYQHEDSWFPASVTVAVVNNVWAALVPYSTVPAVRETPGQPEKIMWRSRKGKLLKTLPF